MQGYLNPAVFSEEKFGTMSANILPAVQLIHNACVAVESAKRDLESDNTLTPDGKLWELEKLYEQRVERHLASTGRELVKSIDIAEQVKGEVETFFRPASDPVSITLASEFRQALRNMPEQERQVLLASAVADGDKSMLLAVLGGHPLLTGISAELSAALRSQYLRTHNPDLHARVERSNTLVATAHSAINELDRLRSRFFDPGTENKLKSIREKRKRVKAHFDQASTSL